MSLMELTVLDSLYRPEPVVYRSYAGSPPFLDGLVFQEQLQDTIHSDGEDLNSALGGHSAGSGFAKHCPGTPYIRTTT
jgi:hypothetical protein